MGYILYSNEEEPNKRVILKRYETAQEAADDLGLTRKQVTLRSSRCRRVWYSPVCCNGQPIIVADKDNRAQNGSSGLKDQAYALIRGGIRDRDEIADRLGCIPTVADKYLKQYSIEFGLKASPGKKTVIQEDKWVAWFRVEWEAARQSILTGRRIKPVHTDNTRRE